MFGDFGKMTVEELWNLLSCLAVKECSFQTQTDAKMRTLLANEFHHYQYKMWNAQQQQLTAIVQCVKEVAETSFYGAPWQEAKNTIRAIRAREIEAATQKVTRRGVKFMGKWYFSEGLLAHQGERVFVKCQNKQIVEVWSVDEECIECIPISKGED